MWMPEQENVINFVDKDGGISSSKQVSRVCAAQHLPNVRNSATMIGIRNIA